MTDAPETCGRLTHPGLALDVPRYVDYSGFETTADQLRLEAELERRGAEGARVLHVGIGDSGFARRFASRCAAIDGVTVSRPEEERALALGLANYRVHRLSKHSRELDRALADNIYDFILDNNLASFACCRYHLYSMLDTYRAHLAPGGEILTDQQGMSWACLPGFILDLAGLERLAERFALRVERRTETVYALRKVEEPAAEDAAELTSWVRCLRDGAWVVEPRKASRAGAHDL